MPTLGSAIPYLYPQWMQVVQAGGGNHSLTHVVDIYRGANNASIRRSNHNQLDVHGLGKEYRYVHHT